MCGSPSPYTKGRQCDHVEAGFRAQGLDLLLSLPLAVGCQRKVRLKWREISGVGMAGLRFWAYQYQHLPLNALRGRWRDAERSGFDVLWNCDTVVEPDRPRHTMFDGPATLTMMAADTSRIRVGTLVTSLYFRQPVPFAKASVTVDHLGGGGSSWRWGWATRPRAPGPAAWTGRLVNGSPGSVSSSSWSVCLAPSGGHFS